MASVPGITPPVYGEIPVTTITETTQYTGTVTWSDSPVTFAATTVYTATITLTANPGYTLTGVAADFFTVAGATSATNSVDSGVVTAVFPATGTPPAGDKVTYTADGVSFIMVYVPGGKTFPTGIDDLGTPATVDNAYWIAETEVTYELWQKVYTWATSGSGATGAGQYTFGNAGMQGDDDTRGMLHPVTTVNWRDSMVWCNAITEWCNANNGTAPDLGCVYKNGDNPIRDSRDNDTGHTTSADICDAVTTDESATGFRLLSSNEWECAARWRGTDTTNVVTATVGDIDFNAMADKWTKGNSASGDTQAYNATTPTVGDYAVYQVNSGTSTAVVKSKTEGYNTLGLYDMSGNVWEWCFDLNIGSTRLLRSGSWDYAEAYLQIGRLEDYDPNSEYYDLGFRIAKSAQ